MQDHKEQAIGHHGFQDTEISKMARAVDYVTQNISKDKTTEMMQFYNFFNAYDLRRNKNFVKTYKSLVKNQFHHTIRSDLLPTPSHATAGAQKALGALRPLPL